MLREITIHADGRVTSTIVKRDTETSTYEDKKRQEKERALFLSKWCQIGTIAKWKKDRG